jgi:hypothetical protein
MNTPIYYGAVSETVPTPLGAVSIQITGGAGVVIEVTSAPVPQLVEDMVCDGVKLVRARIESEVRRDFPLNLYVTANLKGYADSGEWLDSVAYPTCSGNFHIAMRDSDWLKVKGIVADVFYEEQGLRQTVYEAPAGTLLYISIAWRVIKRDQSSTDDLSTWFAADLALPS